MTEATTSIGLRSISQVIRYAYFACANSRQAIERCELGIPMPRLGKGLMCSTELGVH
jgi:hypothetical protein